MNEPVRHSIAVACPVDHAFQVFTRRIDLWWPPSHRKWPGSRLAFEAAVGGRFTETRDDGAEAELGRVLCWEPPHRLTYTWRPGAPEGLTTEVDVRFVADGDRTRIDVVHTEGESGLGELWPTRARLFASSWERVLGAYAGFVALNGP